MTISICIHCMHLSGPISVPCEKCGYRPETGYEIGLSVMLSDHTMRKPALENLSRNLREELSNNGPPSFSLDDNQHSNVEGFLSSPDGRDVLELKRTARNTLFSKEIDLHTIDPDGYETAVVARGKEMEKKEFDRVLGQGHKDLFAVATYVDGERHNIPTEKDIWYCMKDVMRLIERRATQEDTAARALTLQALIFTSEYLLRRGVDVSDQLD